MVEDVADPLEKRRKPVPLQTRSFRPHNLFRKDVLAILRGRIWRSQIERFAPELFF